MQQETASLLHVRDVSNLTLKRSIQLAHSYQRARLEPDSSLSWVYSSEQKRLLFGRSSVELFKVQAGLKIALRQREMRVRLHPSAAEFSSKGQDPLLVSQGLWLVHGDAPGVGRRITVTNKSDSGVRLRLMSLHDPTSLNFRREKDPPCEIGVNAFNRGDHVVMDDVGDTSGVRVIGFSPRPSAIYMTKERQRAVDLLGAAELPDSTAGMSGGIIVLAQQDLDLPPSASGEAAMVSLYHPSSLEVALPALAGATSGRRQPPPQRAEFICSSLPVNFAYAWAASSLDSLEGEEDTLERMAAGFAISVLRGGYFEEMIDSARKAQSKSGYLPRSGGGERGVLETSLMVIQACSHLLMRGDKKLTRRWFPMLKKAAHALSDDAGAELLLSEGSPGGWRRRLGSGFPTGYTFEVNLLAARALAAVAGVAYSLGRGSDSGRFKEDNVRVLNAMKERLRDPESGSYALNLDARGRLHRETVVDHAVALSYYPIDHNFASSVVHRLLEKDFETGFGPRCVPSSNPLYYSPTYGEGQLGGYWTRAALAHAILAYEAGYSSIGSLQLEKVARLVHTDSEKLGGIPGEFPYWVDPEKRAIGSIGSDPVAAARFIEALLVGELGMTVAPQETKFRTPESSQLRWFIFHRLNVGRVGSIFVGRVSGRVFAVSTFGGEEAQDALNFAECELLDQGPLACIVFWSRSSLLMCVGNTSSSAASGVVSVPLRGKPLASSLFADLEELNQEGSSWQRVDRVRLTDRLEMKVEVKPSSWKAYRLVQITS